MRDVGGALLAVGGETDPPVDRVQDHDGVRVDIAADDLRQRIGGARRQHRHARQSPRLRHHRTGIQSTSIFYSNFPFSELCYLSVFLHILIE